ncbi:hypothetical protein Zmor_024383 [Zophobas morio]|uniref:Uncharacterized protein n=1 Tax=Zophobas morio TaxID=2755281 RepID=A0AA38HYG1_9CUCU|nr:hypothetical protein Zmor_024383 [Zophobas morio]
MNHTSPLLIDNSCVVEDLTTAIKDNNLDELKNMYTKVLNRIKNQDGFTQSVNKPTFIYTQILTQLNSRREIFDYLLQFQDEDDLEFRNMRCQTALACALTRNNKIDD